MPWEGFHVARGMGPGLVFFFFLFPPHKALGRLCGCSALGILLAPLGAREELATSTPMKHFCCSARSMPL